MTQYLQALERLSVEPITAHGTHQLVLAIILFGNVTILALYGLFRRLSGFKLRKIGLTIGAIGGILFAAPAILAGPDSPEWLQSLLVALRATAFDAAIAYICYLTLESAGPKYPQWLNTLLGTYWWTLGIVTGYSILIALIWPLPMLENSYYPNEPIHVLLFKARHLWEILFTSVVSYVFVSEAVTQRLPNPARRLQFILLSVSCVAFLLLSLDNLAGTVLSIVSAPAERLQPLVDLQLQLQMWLLIAALTGITLGMIARDACSLHQKLVDSSLQWIGDSCELDIDLDYYCADFDDTVVGQRLTTSIRERMLGDFEGECSKNMVKIAVLLAVQPGRRGLIERLYTNQQEIGKHSNITGRLLMGWRGEVRYTVFSDPVYAAIEPALSLLDQEAPTSLQAAPEWIQLAARAMDDIPQLLPDSVAGTFAFGASISRGVYAAYPNVRGNTA